jgi:hypothetical protein
MKEIALHILDMAENSIQAGADRIQIALVKEETSGLLKVRMEDNGRGMSPEEKDRSLDPFFTSRTTRRVGLGIPLIRQHAEMSGGGLHMFSLKGKGTRVEANFGWAHPDRQPLGDLEGCWLLLAMSNPEIEWELQCASDAGEFSISSSEIKSELEVTEIKGSELKDALKIMIRNNILSLGLA